MFFISILFIGIVLASAVSSLVEAAVLSLPMIRARILVEQKLKNARDLLYVKENIAYTIASIVIFNNTVNIVGSIFVGHQVAKHYGDEWLGITSTIVTFILIIASEIIPKAIGERHKVPISLIAAKPLRFVVWFARPLVNLIMMICHPFIEEQKIPKVTEDEIRMMLKLARAEGTVETDEEVLCNRVFKLNDVRAAQIMKPMDQIFTLPSNKTLEELKDIIMGSPYSRIAVYDKDPLDIVGTVQQAVLLKEMAKGNYSARVKDMMNVPVFVNWFMKADALLEKFQAHQQHLFIVQDSHGKDVGLVTMEDVLEELFGEIYDEKDSSRQRVDSFPYGKAL